MGLSFSEKRMLKKERNDALVRYLTSIDDDAKATYLADFNVLNDMLKSNFKISPDTLIVAGSSLLQVLLVLNFERFDILRSKAVGFILRGRV